MPSKKNATSIGDDQDGGNEALNDFTNQPPPAYTGCTFADSDDTHGWPFQKPDFGDFGTVFGGISTPFVRGRLFTALSECHEQQFIPNKQKKLIWDVLECYK